MRKRVIVLGSTGSIGQSTLDVLEGISDQWEVVGLAAHSNGAFLAKQANRFQPTSIALSNGECTGELEATLSYRPTILRGADSLVDLVNQVECDCVVSAIVGARGLQATVRAVELGRQIALASKEILVVAGSVVMPLAKTTGAEIIPVDSEHSAVMQALHAGNRSEVRKVYLTASGGPFWSWNKERMQEITIEDALRHPTWKMGPKITVDSATMMNKALEIVEARWLFDLLPEQIEVVIHPESIIHSLVEFCDGSMVAQLGSPDMRTPIQYALTYPKRFPCPSPRLDLVGLGRLNFHAPDLQRFPALRLGHEVAVRGGTAGAVLNAAGEAAVEHFRKGQMGFLDIAPTVERALDRHDWIESPTLDELLAADRWARNEVKQCMVC